MSDIQVSACGLTDLRQATRWREERAADVFQTGSAWDWFKRNHFDELLASGQLIPGRGRRGDLVGPGIDDVVVRILRREAGQHDRNRGG